MADNDQDRGQQGLQDQKQAVAQRKRQPPRVSGNLKPRLSASFPAKGEMTAPTQEPGKRTRPLIKLLVPIKDRA